MSGHRHEPCDIYGLDGIRQDAREALSLAAGLREDLGRAEERIRDLEERLSSLERDTPQARQLQMEADLAAADLAAAGYDERGDPIGADRHGPGCLCPWCFDEPEEEPPVEEYDPGPEVDDEGGMSEYRHAGTPEEPW